MAGKVPILISARTAFTLLKFLAEFKSNCDEVFEDDMTGLMASASEFILEVEKNITQSQIKDVVKDIKIDHALGIDFDIEHSKPYGQS